MVVISGLGVLTINQLFISGYHNGMKARVAICSIIYRKVSKFLMCSDSKLYFENIEGFAFIA